ncbi:exo-alpha-sialidase [PVC group bacterium]|nr:exo-alpha-sialidase [PVC group bacterium]
MTTPTDPQYETDLSEIGATVIDHAHVSTRTYMPTSSIVILPDGTYVVAHDHGSFDHSKSPDINEIFESKDKGESWEKLSEVPGRWDSLFYHRGTLYLFGPSGMHKDAVIYRSDDGGRTWTNPVDRKSGLLDDSASYHSAGVPVVVHNGRVWRAFEQSIGGSKGRPSWTCVVFSAPEDADLLDADNWTISEPIHHKGAFRQWIEGNIVVTPEGKIVNILRANGYGGYKGDPDYIDKAAIVHVSNDGKRLSHDPLKDIIDFPGGGSKFTIRFDEESGRFWSLVNKQKNPKANRHRLYLTSSSDLRNWTVEKLILSQPDPERSGLHYADFVIEGDDIVFTLRTAWPDGVGGPSDYHDNNYITFHRIENFRNL